MDAIVDSLAAPLHEFPGKANRACFARGLAVDLPAAANAYRDKELKITRKYIMRFRTDKGAWTRAQIEALGLQWTPRKGWIESIIGKHLDAEGQRIFESRMTMSEYKLYLKARGLKRVRMAKTGKTIAWEEQKAAALRKHHDL